MASAKGIRVIVATRMPGGAAIVTDVAFAQVADCRLTPAAVVL